MKLITNIKAFGLLLSGALLLSLSEPQVEINTTEKKMKIEIWSDVVCPWCYIGKRRFEAALKDFEHAEYLDIEWKSYQLDPEMETDPSISTYEYLATRKGMSMAQAKAMGDNVTEVAKGVGLTYDFSKTIPINTIKAHRLLHFAKSLDKQGEMKEALLNAYFIEAKNLDDNETLADIASKVGIDKKQALVVLESDAFLKDVQSDINEAVQLGLRGVPFFVFNRKYGVSGAQQEKVFLNTLEKSFKDWVKTNPKGQLQIIDGKVCTPDGICD
jgi:predicted DsbA family dithiol-disulfide isomerase